MLRSRAHYLAAALVLASATGPLASVSLAQAPVPLRTSGPQVATVVNSRAATLSAFYITDARGALVASIQKPLPGGQTLRLRLTPPSGCEYTIDAKFEDGNSIDAFPVNLCADATLRLTE